MRNRSLWLACLLSVVGGLEVAVGLGLLSDPDAVTSLLVHSSLNPAGVVVGRIAGAALLSLGIACLFARKTPLTPASLGVGWGLLTYNVGACLTLASVASQGVMALVGSIAHGLISAALLIALLVRNEPGTQH